MVWLTVRIEYRPTEEIKKHNQRTTEEREKKTHPLTHTDNSEELKREMCT